MRNTQRISFCHRVLFYSFGEGTSAMLVRLNGHPPPPDLPFPPTNTPIFQTIRQNTSRKRFLKPSEICKILDWCVIYHYIDWLDSS